VSEAERAAAYEALSCWYGPTEEPEDPEARAYHAEWASEAAHYDLVAFLFGKPWADEDRAKRKRAKQPGELERQRASRARAQETYATLTKGPWKPPR